MKNSHKLSMKNIYLLISLLAVAHCAHGSAKLSTCLPAAKVGRTAAVVICPGGGYTTLCDTYEGDDMARWLVERGVAAFALRYRLAPKYHGKEMLEDIREALCYVREHAEELNVDPHRVGVLGFSAGGHLACLAGTTDADWRADFMALVYPHISMAKDIGHGYMRERFLGAGATDEDIRQASGELLVDERTPPTFLVHARTDEVCSVEHSRRFAAAMRKKGRSVDYLELESGRHGLGCGRGEHWHKWLDAFEKWLSEMGATAAALEQLANACPRIIFDTDMYTDYDDVGALAILHALADRGECELIAVGSNTYGDGNKSVAVCEIISAYYGRGNLPVGCARVGGREGAGHRGYGLPEKYPQWVRHAISTNAPPAVDVYRKALLESPDQSVVLCSVGFLNNVAELLRTDAALVERKVRLWVCMACSYPTGKEYNVKYDAASADYAFSHWPKTVPVVWTDFQYGRTCYAGRAVAEMPAVGNPVKDAFAAYLTPRAKVVPGKSWDQLSGHPSWDETAALIAVRGWKPYFTLQRGCYRVVGSEGDDEWVDDPTSINGRVDECADFSRAEVARVLDGLMCQPPRRHR